MLHAQFKSAGPPRSCWGREFWFQNCSRTEAFGVDDCSRFSFASNTRTPLRLCRKIRRGNSGDVVDGGGKPSPFWASRHLLQPPETTTTTGICPAISGATQNSPCFECSRLVDLSLLNLLAHSSQLCAHPTECILYCGQSGEDWGRSGCGVRLQVPERHVKAGRGGGGCALK